MVNVDKEQIKKYIDLYTQNGKYNIKIELYEKNHLIKNGRFNSSKSEEMKKFWEHDLDKYNIFITTNSLGADKWNRKEENITYWLSFALDYDFKDYLDRFDSFETFETCMLNQYDYFCRNSKITPSYLARSGHGFHIVYFFSDPIKIETSENLKIMKEWVKELANAFDLLVTGLPHDKKVGLATQIFRLPGSLNVKYLDNPKKCEILRENTSPYISIADLGLSLGVPYDLYKENNIERIREELKPKEKKERKTKVYKSIEPKLPPTEHPINRDDSHAIKILVPSSFRGVLHYRINMLYKLLELRKYDVVHYRDQFLFILFQSHLALYRNVYLSADEVFKMNDMFLEPLEKNEIIDRIINFVPLTEFYKLPNKFIEERLNITDEENRLLSKKKRKEQDSDKDKLIALYYIHGFKQQVIADKLGISKSCVSKTLKRLNVNKDTVYSEIDFETNAKYAKGNYRKTNDKLSEYHEQKRLEKEEIIYEEIS